MATREEKIAFLQSQTAGGQTDSAPARTREEKIAFLQSQAAPAREASQGEGSALSRLGNSALEAASTVGKFVDSYTGAPIRKGIGEAQEGNNPFPAMASQFGADPSLAPTGKQLAQRAGVTDTSLSEVIPSLYTDSDSEANQWGKFKRGGSADISASGAAGLGLDIAADPTNFIPGVAIAKGSKLAGKGLKAASQITKSGAIPVLDKAADILKSVTVKAGSTLTGLPEKNIATYIEKTKEVNDLIAKHGGDMSLAADDLREGLQRAIQTKIGSLNDDVRKAIDASPVGSFASNEAIVKALEHVKAGVNPTLYPGSISEIDGLLTKIKGLSPDPDYINVLSPGARKEITSAITADAANQAKRFLQDQAKGSYIKGGQLFTSSKEASKAAKAGAREARKVEMALAPGTIGPNKDLARLHRYQDNVNRNLIAPGKTEAALMGAGSGGNARNAKNLKDIGEMTGFDAIGEAEKLSTAKAFANPSMLPVDATGKSATRMALGAMVGSWAAGPFGTAAGIAATSPALLKKAIQTGKASGDLIKHLAGGASNLSDNVIERAIKVAGTERGQQLIRSAEKASKQANIQDTNRVAEGEDPGSRPLKGQEKWANDGLKRLQDHSSSSELSKMKGALLSSPKGKKLLIAASDLKPGSKAMDQVMSQINKEFGGKN